ncbi:MAG TPA: zinc-ribbon domain-containing protein [Pyrinomonadaceae bacterium]|jgi:hypothetical protein
MFCPKCGTQNPETGKFCRACGTDLGNVSAIISGNPPAEMMNNAGVAHIHHEARRRQDPNEVFGDGVRNIILGIGFLIVSTALLLTNVAGGKGWWWAMLFPAFGLLASGISNYLKYQRMERKQNEALNQNQTNQTPNLFSQPRQNSALPPTQPDYVRPQQKSIYETGELYEKPSSVTEGTTRHLEINNEGETMTLPKQK